jgi:glucose 1-dehydrogenase
LRIRGLEVVTFALPEPPNLNATLAEGVGAHYVSARRKSFRQTSAELGPFDLIFEATGYAPLIFEAMEVLGKNGVLVVTGLSGGGREVTIPADTINAGFVLHNKAMVGTVNANREHFEAGIRDLASCETQYPGWLAQLLTHRIEGLDDYQRVNDLIVTASPEDRPIKAYVVVSTS